VEPNARPSFIAIARIVRPRGNRGEVLADSHTDFPARFDLLKEVWLSFQDGHRQVFVLEDCWEHQGRLVFKFAGVDSISSADELRGAWVEVTADLAVALPPGSYFDHDLVGCEVCNGQGKILGKVAEVLRITGNSQLVVRAENGEFLVPATAEICREISTEQKRIVVELPEGLIDLNK
jgi:16S rRNA processing protein RimM